MPRKLIYFATCRELPEPDPDQELLLAALAAQGLESRMLAWDDGPKVEPADLCVIRSLPAPSRRAASRGEASRRASSSCASG